MSQTNDSNNYEDLTDSAVMDHSETVEKILKAIGIIIGIFIGLVLLRLYIQGPKYRKKNRIDGKVCIVTGCNTGIGKETALELAKRGAKVYMACRNYEKCEISRLDIIKKSNNQKVYNYKLDLSSLSSVKEFSEKFHQNESRLDILINNAGIMASPKTYTKDGYEQQFGVNHLGHFYLTNLLLDLLKKSAPSRIVVVSSALYFIGKLKKNDINSEKSYTRFSAYNQSKFANVVFTKELSRKLHGTGVTVNCCHPGVVKTELSRHIIKGFTKIFLTPFTTYLMKTPEAGAQTSIRLAIDPSLENVSGHYYFDTYYRFPILSRAKNPELGKWLWKISEEMINNVINKEKDSNETKNTSQSSSVTVSVESSNQNAVELNTSL